MSKVLGFSIEIQGERAVIEKAADVQLAIREINKQLKQTSDSAEYDKLEKELLRLKGTLKEVRAQQRQTVNEFTATAEGVGAYRQMSAQLNVARQRFKDLAAAGQEYTEEAQAALKETQRLDAELKRIDASAGQFQRNVGNYPTTVTAVIESTLPAIGQMKDGFAQVNEISSRTGRIIARSFIIFGVVNEIAKGVDALGEFSKEFQELRRQASASTQLVGQELDELVVKTKAAADTFQVEYIDLLEAARTASIGFGTDASEAIDSISTALLGVADQQRFIGDLNTELNKLTQLGIGQDSALALLAQSVNNNFNIDVIAEPLLRIRERTEATRTAIENAIGTQAAEELFRDFEKRPIEAIQRISQELNELDINSAEAGALLADVFSAAGEDNVVAARSIANLTTNLDELIASTGRYSQRQIEVLAANRELIEAQNELTKATETFSAANETLGIRIKTAFTNIAANAINGFQESLAGLSAGFSFFEVKLKRFTLEAEKLNPFGRPTEEIQEDLRIIDEGLAGLAEQGVDSVFDAILAANRKRRQETNKLADELAEERKERQKRQKKEEQEQAEKDAAELSRKEAEAYRKERAKQQADLLLQDRKDQAARLQLLNQLNLQLVEATIDLMEDEREREIAQREQDFEVRKQVLQDQQAEQLDLLEQREQEIIDLFGRKSDEYLNFIRERKETEQELTDTTNALIVQLEADKLRDIEEINERARESEQRRLLEESQSRIKQIQNASEIELLELDEQFAKKLISEEDYWDEVDRIRIAALRRQNDQLRLELSTQTDLTEEEYQRRILSIKKNEAEIAKLQAGGTDRDERGEQALADKQRENFEQSLGYAQQSLSVLDNFAQGIAERQNQRYQEQIDAQQSLVSNLEEEFETAVGLKRVQLAEELEAERAALSQSVEAQEQANREAARQEKAIAILQSIVNTALAVTRALATGGPVAAGVVGALGAVQTATIAAQPFAEGGVVTPVQLSDGKIIATKNIPTMANGDNVLATVKTGEVILNERHVQMLGPEVFRSLGVPGFDRGGVAGRLAEPIAPPIMPLLAMRSQQDIGRAIESLDRKTDAINARIDRLRAVVVSEDVEKDLQDKQDNLRLRTL